MNERGGDANGRGAPNTLPMVIVLEKELAAISMRPGDDVKSVLDKIKDTYARMAAAGSSVSQLQQCTKIISVLDNSWDNLIPTLNSQQDQWTPEWLRQQILQEDFRRRHVKGANGELVGLGNVLLVEGLSANLLSMRRLQKSKAEVTFGPTSCRAKLGKKVLWSLEEETSCIKDLWQLPIIPWNGKTPTAATAAAAKATAGGDATAPTDGVLEGVKKVQQQQTHGEVLAGVDASAAWAKASSKSGEADWETWHERLCHVNFSMLQKLVKDGSLKGLEVKGGVKEIRSCPTCLETKFSKFPFNSTTGPAKTPLALVHMDVVGPTRAPSLSGSRYFLTIVDDHTRAVWVYPLKSKGEVAAAVLKEWMPRAQRECGYKVKVIRSDNGGEFIGADFEGELKRKGIQHQLTVPYNPQQNGVAERFNRTLQEGHALSLGEKRGKLEASGRWGVHLGIAKDHKAWLLWDLTTQKLTVSRDVKFLESLYYKEWKQQQQKLPSTPLVVEVDEVQQPSRQVEVAVSEEEMSGVTEEGGAAEVEQQQQQHESPPRKAITSKMIYRHKYGPEGELTRYKSRLVARGFQQTKGKDYDEVFAPVGKGTTLRVLLAIAALLGWKIRQMDIVTAFLNGIILEEVYMKQPEGLDDGSGRVCRLKKAIYGLKQAPRAWYHKLEEALLAGGFKKNVEKGVLRLHQRKYCEGLAEKYGLQDGGKPATPLPSGFTVEPCADEEVVGESDRKLIGGYVCLLGGGAVSWRSKKQNEVGLSSCETEYMALHHGAKEVVWLRRLLEELGVGQEEPTVVFCDNESAVKLAKNACLHGLTKHIRPKWHWVRRLLDKEVRLEIVKTHQQAADIFTKRLAEADHWKGMKLAGMNS
ncbi:hypothetical protein CLOM_g19620 [Closterium sp. NIES-68]|nr:hypothetical protein CLOM_g19620 [Closterium sp. NIES-68]